MKLGYLRVSTQEQRPDRQIDGLSALCDELHIEYVSAVSRKRPVYDTLMRRLGTGDSLIVWDLDRAFRSTVDALVTAEKLVERGVTFQIVSLKIDTATPAGKLVYTMMAAFAAYEREILARRTREGLAAARRRGKRLGRPPKLSMAQLTEARAILETGTENMGALADRFGVAPWTLSRALKRPDRNSGQ
jgi:DNA invertase Pin-like site-specific DNA recombinase